MSKTMLRLSPVYKECLWGGNKLRTVFGLSIPSDNTGECWSISGHLNGDCAIQNPEFHGETLGSLWKNRRDLFGDIGGNTFPLLTKIIDARQDLSIQVHPDDAYAGVHENGALGKTECWYVLDCDPDATIVIGHNAGSREEMKQMVAQDRWDELLRVVPIQKGDFFQIEPGCLHAIKGGTLILEVQQSSDVTYRFYDYGRLQNGKPRTLHLEKCLDVTSVPFSAEDAIPATIQVGNAVITHLVSCGFYTVGRVVNQGYTVFAWNKPFVGITILSGEGTMDGHPVQKGDNLVLCSGYGELLVNGTLEFIYSHL